MLAWCCLIFSFLFNVLDIIVCLFALCPLCCLSFFDLERITSLVSSNFILKKRRVIHGHSYTCTFGYWCVFINIDYPTLFWRSLIVIALDLQLPGKSVPITTKVVSSNSAHGEVYSIQHYLIKLSVTCGRSVVFTGFLHQ